MSDERTTGGSRGDGDLPPHDDYLWDRSGAVDPEVERLESLLAPFGHDPSAAEERPRLRLWPAVAAAVLVGSLAVGALVSGQVAAPQGPGWDVTVLGGAPHIGGDRVDGSGVLRPGDVLVTGAGESARVSVADIGRVDVAPNSVLRLVASAADEHRIALDRGRIEAVVVAPPRLFLVETPGALAVDLGCAYELDVAQDGSGRLRVTAGWVALARDGGETIVPEGAICRIDATGGPGVPRYEASSGAFDAALDRVEAGDGTQSAVDAVVAAAARHDVLSLWYLIPRVEAGQRRALIRAVADVEPMPAGVSIDGIATLDARQITAWQSELQRLW